MLRRLFPTFSAFTDDWPFEKWLVFPVIFLIVFGYVVGFIAMLTVGI